MVLIFGAGKIYADSSQASWESGKPSLVLLYATWADDAAACLENFNSLKNIYGNRVNLAVLDIASPQMKVFNKKYVLQPNLPYVMMFKSQGKITRYMFKDCILDDACIVQKTKSFIN